LSEVDDSVALKVVRCEPDEGTVEKMTCRDSFGEHFLVDPSRVIMFIKGDTLEDSMYLKTFIFPITLSRFIDE